MRHLHLLIISLAFLSSCQNHLEKPVSNKMIFEAEPVLRENGKWIEFNANSEQAKLFSSVKAENRKSQLSISAPATVTGKVKTSSDNSKSTILLFDTPDITGVYSAYMQNLTLEKTAKINFDRVNDLYKNGAATGKELNDASSELTTAQTSLSENEARLREAGLDPGSLNVAPLGTVWLICDLPESELNLIKKGQKYTLSFPSFPNESFTANIDLIAEVMNSQTRKIRIRLSLIDKQDRIRPGMYSEVKFESPHQGLMVPKKAVISANATYYVFVKRSETLFERREVTLSSETGDYIEIAEGLKAGEEVVATNVYLLKGIDLGI